MDYRGVVDNIESHYGAVSVISLSLFKVIVNH